MAPRTNRKSYGLSNRAIFNDLNGYTITVLQLLYLPAYQEG